MTQRRQSRHRYREWKAATKLINSRIWRHQGLTTTRDCVFKAKNRFSGLWRQIVVIAMLRYNQFVVWSCLVCNNFAWFMWKGWPGINKALLACRWVCHTAGSWVFQYCIGVEKNNPLECVCTYCAGWWTGVGTFMRQGLQRFPRSSSSPVAVLFLSLSIRDLEQ
jgi:hypothetical protein